MSRRTPENAYELSNAGQEPVGNGSPDTIRVTRTGGL